MAEEMEAKKQGGLSLSPNCFSISYFNPTFHLEFKEVTDIMGDNEAHDLDNKALQSHSMNTLGKECG
jgi:hypothetical protein